MKKILALVGALLLLGNVAKADLLGDNVTYAHYFPDTSSPIWSGSTTIAAGNSDVVNSYWYAINGEANSITVNFTYGSAQWTWGVGFNGLVVSGIDDLINSVTVNTNLVGWDSSRLSVSGGSIWSDWQGLAFNNDSYFVLNVNQSVPDSGSMIALLGGALVGVAAFRRKFGRA